MSKKITALVLGAMFLALSFPIDAQQPAKIPRVGYLDAVSPSTNAARTGAFRQGLRELGYVKGKNIVIEWRSADGKFDRLPALAAELVRLKVDVIVTAGAAATPPSKEATSTIPMVMTQDSDPVGTGLVASLWMSSPLQVHPVFECGIRVPRVLYFPNTRKYIFASAGSIVLAAASSR